MEIETKQINITTVYPEDILYVAQTKVSEIRNKIIELWDDAPIITQFPEVIAIIAPKKQISITIQNRVIVISDQNIIPFESRDIENLLRLVKYILGLIPGKFTAYGYNFNYIFPINDSNQALFSEKINNIMNFETLSIDSANVLGCGLNFAYEENNTRYQIVASPQFAEDLKNPVSFISQFNVHFFKDELPEYSLLSESFISEHKNRKDFLSKIFKS